MTLSLVLANLAIAMLLAFLVWQVLSASRRSHEAQARDVSAGIAAVAKLNVESELGRIDGVMRATAAEVERLLAQPAADADQVLNDVLGERLKLLADVEAFRLADAQGLVRWGNSLPAGAPVNITDRDYFQQARQLGEATLVAGPLQSRVSGNWVIAFVRPVRVDGRFAGALYVSVDVGHFQRLFQRYDLEPLDAIALRLRDLRLVARFSPSSPVQGTPGDRTVPPELRPLLAQNPQQGALQSRAPLDGEYRSTTYRALDGWPLIVLAGVNDERFLRPWRQQAWTVATLATLVWLICAFGSWSVLRADAKTDRALQALAQQNQRVRALLRVAADGIHIVDRGGRLVEMSDSFAEMLRSTREKLLGRHVWSWDAHQDEAAIGRWLARVRDGDRQRVDVQHRRDDGVLIDVELHMSVTQIGGETLVFASGRDVTQVRRLIREQAAMLDSDLTGIIKIADRTITWSNRAVERIFGYGPGELDGAPMRALYLDDESYEALGRELYPALASQSQYRSQVRMRRKNGEPVWIDFGVARLSPTEIFVMAVDITVMKEAHDRLSHAALHDALTQLPNRVLLYDRIEQALAVAVREQRQIAVGYFDLDGFKAVNDQHGHEAGDQLLQQIAQRLARGVRAADTVARIGGDEFVVLLTSLEDEDWRAVFERLVMAIDQPVRLASGCLVSVGATVGVSLSALQNTSSAYELVQQADHIMLNGKRGGKGGVRHAPAPPPPGPAGDSEDAA
jgi:diguanylate cyclase (GGDEF)-like protein/PAS domain S-box-containing protein